MVTATKAPAILDDPDTYRIRLSEYLNSLPVVMLPTAQIVIKRDLGRAKLNQKKVDEYAEYFDDLPPIIVYLISDEYVLVDGFHRVAAVMRIHRDEIAAVLVEGKELRDAYWDAATLNSDHGIPLGEADKVQMAKNRLAFFPERSNRWIARDLNVDNKFVKKCRTEMQDDGLIEYQPKYQGEDGKWYPQEQGERDEQIRRERERDPDVSDREIAERVGVSHTTVANVLAKVSDEEVAAAYDTDQAQSSQIVADAQAATKFRKRSEQQLAALFEKAPKWNPKKLKGELVEADCFDYMQQMLDSGLADSVDFLCTDPPYGIGRGEYDEFKSDEEFTEFTARWLYLALQLIKPTGHIAVFWGGPWGPRFDHTKILPDLLQGISDELSKGFWLENMLIWQHNDTLSLIWPDDRNAPNYDIIWVYAGPEARSPSRPLNYGKTVRRDAGVPNRGSIWQDLAFRYRLHRAQKPIDVVKGLVDLRTRPDDVVLDPFAGSGTLAVACELSGRRWICIENNPEYCKIARARIMLEGVERGHI